MHLHALGLLESIALLHCRVKLVRKGRRKVGCKEKKKKKRSEGIPALKRASIGFEDTSVESGLSSDPAYL
ncbi:hypothetical protein LB504_012573 [Fusarium proliferatum]|nr:hypothetical protein LB504_012573 [Fusarium proliferatum]